MNAQNISEELIDFIQDCPSMFHSVQTSRRYLDEAGFTYLAESSAWAQLSAGKYYTQRNDSSLIAFTIGENLDNYHFQLTAAHSDSPTYKVKAKAEVPGNNGYITLNTEAYGGMIDSTWLDRPLSVAGRVLIEEDGKICSKLVFIDDDILLIPNVAPHLNREVNKGYEYNRACDMRPLFTCGDAHEGDFDAMIANELNIDTNQILGKDLFLVNRQKPCIWGYKKEFVSSPKLDDLQCAFAALKSFIQAKNTHCVNVFCLFDNEEVGSNTKQGAMSTFLPDTLSRINAGLNKSYDEYRQALAKSFLVSCDNAHAIHPNKGELHDSANGCVMNKGLAIKEAANQSYTTDAFSRGVFACICKKAGVPTQVFANRSDRAGGSTLGNLSNIQVSMHSVDFGLPQLAMHSSYETAGVLDTQYAIRALTEFYNTNIQIQDASLISLGE